MKKFLLLLSLVATAAFAQPTTPLANTRFSGTNNVVLDAASLKFGTTTPGSISGAAGAITVAASGTNQSITLTPSGTGGVLVSGATPKFSLYESDQGANDKNWQFQAASQFLLGRVAADDGNSGNSWLRVARNGLLATSIEIFTGAEAANAKFVSTHLLLGGLTTDGTGILQLPVATTSAGGITLGDNNLYRISATSWVSKTNTTVNQFVLDTTGASIGTSVVFNSNGANKWDVGYAAGSGTGTAFEIYNRVTSANALSIASADSTATFAANVALANLLPGASNIIKWSGRSVLESPANGALRLTFNDGTAAATFTSTAGALAISGAAGNMTITAGTGNSRTMTFQTTTSGGTATTFLVADATQGMTAASLAGSGSRAVLADANGLLSAPVSDETVKENLRALPDSMGLETVMQLRPLIYNYKDRSRFGNQEYIGFGARATAAILPQVTGQDRDGVFYMNKEDLTASLVKAVQQQERKIEALEAIIAGMKN